MEKGVERAVGDQGDRWKVVPLEFFTRLDSSRLVGCAYFAGELRLLIEVSTIHVRHGAYYRGPLWMVGSAVVGA